MFEKIFMRAPTLESEGIRLKREYLRQAEMQNLRAVLVLLGAKFVPRLNIWKINPENIERFESVLVSLNRQVDARAELGYSSGQERKRLEAAKDRDIRASRVLKAEIFKARLSYCEACAGKGQIHYRVVPKAHGGTDGIDNFAILCRSCQQKIRSYLNKNIAEELLKREPNWFRITYDEAVTKIVDGDDSG